MAFSRWLKDAFEIGRLRHNTGCELSWVAGWKLLLSIWTQSKVLHENGNHKEHDFLRKRGADTTSGTYPHYHHAVIKILTCVMFYASGTLGWKVSAYAETLNKRWLINSESVMIYNQFAWIISSPNRRGDVFQCETNWEILHILYKLINIWQIVYTRFKEIVWASNSL